MCVAPFLALEPNIFLAQITFLRANLKFCPKIKGDFFVSLCLVLNRKVKRRKSYAWTSETWQHSAFSLLYSTVYFARNFSATTRYKLGTERQKTRSSRRLKDGKTEGNRACKVRERWEHLASCKTGRLVYAAKCTFLIVNKKRRMLCRP